MGRDKTSISEDSISRGNYRCMSRSITKRYREIIYILVEEVDV